MAGEVPSSGQAAGHRVPARPGVPDAPLALYRRYRPATFAEVKGQEHVTEPLRQALRTGRVHHAYLFSGPRGCGKTSSARILARSLNCEAGPTPDPCGVCTSCVALAPAGPGSIDVIEIDAASHGGIDDARDLRERAFYSPVSARYKIYIIDEAHMVTGGGFNALLKLVEEPPPHLKFVFATTEPEKVIPTIRSRTHHYPFRLVPPAVLRVLLEEILSAEGVSYEPAVLPVVIRAGAGSVRDSLSVLDQLMAGADDSGLRYDRAIALLGYTDDALLDEMAAAFAHADGAAVFRTIDRVVEAGHDPRRFAADLLDRLRDLIVLAAVPDAGASGLIDVPEDRLERMRKQGAEFGQDRLVRAAETVSAGLVEMRGATSPRLLLELMCAQVLLPAAAVPDSDLAARVERLERRPMAAGSGAAAPAGQRPVASAAPAGQRPVASAAPAGQRPAAPAGQSARAGQDAAPGRVRSEVAEVPADASPASARISAATGSAGPVMVDTATVRDRWPDVLESIRGVSKVAWVLLGNAVVESVAGTVLTLAFDGEGYAKGFVSSSSDQTLSGVLETMLGSQLTVRTSVQPPGTHSGVGGAQAGGPGGAADGASETGGAASVSGRAADSATGTVGESAIASSADGMTGSGSGTSGRASGAQGDADTSDADWSNGAGGGADEAASASYDTSVAGAGGGVSAGVGAGGVGSGVGAGGVGSGVGAGGGAGQRSATGTGRAQASRASRAAANGPVGADEPRPLTDTKPGAAGHGTALSGTDLIEQALGGRVIEEISET
jgi:DNA polymerase-3 subunit gamma/tau